MLCALVVMISSHIGGSQSVSDVFRSGNIAAASSSVAKTDDRLERLKQRLQQDKGGGKDTHVYVVTW